MPRKRELGSGRQMLDAIDAHRRPVAHIDRSSGAGHHDDGWVMHSHDKTTACLDRCGRLDVAHQPIGEAVRRSIRSATATDAEVHASESAKVLERTGNPLADDLDHARTNRTRSPAITSAGLSRSTSNIVAVV